MALLSLNIRTRAVIKIIFCNPSNHPISDDSFKILSNSNVFDLKVKVLESLYIHKLQPNLNDYNISFDLHIVK